MAAAAAAAWAPGALSTTAGMELSPLQPVTSRMCESAMATGAAAAAAAAAPGTRGAEMSPLQPGDGGATERATLIRRAAWGALRHALLWAAVLACWLGLFPWLLSGLPNRDVPVSLLDADLSVRRGPGDLSAPGIGRLLINLSPILLYVLEALLPRPRPMRQPMRLRSSSDPRPNDGGAGGGHTLSAAAWCMRLWRAYVWFCVHCAAGILASVLVDLSWVAMPVPVPTFFQMCFTSFDINGTIPNHFLQPPYLMLASECDNQAFSLGDKLNGALSGHMTSAATAAATLFLYMRLMHHRVSPIRTAISMVAVVYCTFMAFSRLRDREDHKHVILLSVLTGAGVAASVVFIVLQLAGEFAPRTRPPAASSYTNESAAAAADPAATAAAAAAGDSVAVVVRSDVHHPASGSHGRIGALYTHTRLAVRACARLPHAVAHAMVWLLLFVFYSALRAVASRIPPRTFYFSTQDAAIASSRFREGAPLSASAQALVHLILPFGLLLLIAVARRAGRSFRQALPLLYRSCAVLLISLGCSDLFVAYGRVCVLTARPYLLHACFGLRNRAVDPVVHDRPPFFASTNDCTGRVGDAVGGFLSLDTCNAFVSSTCVALSLRSAKMNPWLSGVLWLVATVYPWMLLLATSYTRSSAPVPLLLSALFGIALALLVGLLFVPAARTAEGGSPQMELYAPQQQDGTDARCGRGSGSGGGLEAQAPPPPPPPTASPVLLPVAASAAAAAVALRGGASDGDGSGSSGSSEDDRLAVAGSVQ